MISVSSPTSPETARGVVGLIQAEADDESQFTRLFSVNILREIPSFARFQVISSIFLRKKKNGSYRMILNLEGLNEFIEYEHFKMESLVFAVQLMRKNCYMASIDLTDTYYTVPVVQEHRKYLQFMWGGKLFQYACLPNGLSSAPRYFTTVSLSHSINKMTLQQRLI